MNKIKRECNLTASDDPFERNAIINVTLAQTRIIIRTPDVFRYIYVYLLCSSIPSIYVLYTYRSVRTHARTRVAAACIVSNLMARSCTPVITFRLIPVVLIIVAAR